MILPYQAAWQMVKFEIDATLRKVCDDVLQDKSVDTNTRCGRAKGLSLLDDLFVASTDTCVGHNH
ncbi:hypothetical protein BC941DRAFT_465059 [Chlamydoabsidia padenii]|nr:hypothetical protein BC941DRAFT_465059 [Chlamydoabsidia padenii]